MLGMEPRQIARVVRQQEALFGSVYEGLIAVDSEGFITAINRNARKMLGLSSPGRQWLGNLLQMLCSLRAFLPKTLPKSARMCVHLMG